ncbi:helix-turn-helix transcriptional regulator [Actinomycetospora sp. OC33-EN08]|uniref:Helix-turn-helix transcriptional regulator n=1 Tax=Actinomycetospora aurantiaca TaxID=3129233 RepID=A0ABU8MS39_9PSEU
MTAGDAGSEHARRAPRADSAIPGLPPWADEDTPVFVISIAAEFSGMHAQTLRSYDRIGLVSPGRASGGGRRYSVRDIALLREVQRLSQEEGVNLAGIKRIIELEREVDQLTDRLAELTDELARSQARLQALTEQAGRPGDLLPARRTQSVVVWQPARRRRAAPDDPDRES